MFFQIQTTLGGHRASTFDITANSFDEAVAIGDQLAADWDEKLWMVSRDNSSEFCVFN